MNLRAIVPGFSSALSAAIPVAVWACGSSPRPEVAEVPVQEEVRPPSRSAPLPQVSQELGSINQAKVEQLLINLQSGPFETCHKQGRARVEFLAGDVKIFLRIDGSGRAKYGFFEESTLGDVETEKCIWGALSATQWPKPEGGEAEVRTGFGWGPGGEREPSTWPSDNVTHALASAKAIKSSVDACKRGLKGDFRVTAYVEAHEAEEPAPAHGTHGKNGKTHAKPKPKVAVPPPAKAKEEAGRFKAIGVAVTSRDAFEKVDCIVESLKPLDLPSPGSHPVKVIFSL